MRFKRNQGTYDVSDWNDWFAWYPVEVNGELVWLETIQRKGTKFLGAVFDHGIVLPEEEIKYEYRNK